MGWAVGSRGDAYIHLRLIHVDVWQKPTQYYKAIILQLKINKIFKKHVLFLLQFREVRGREKEEINLNPCKRKWNFFFSHFKKLLLVILFLQPSHSF